MILLCFVLVLFFILYVIPDIGFHFWSAVHSLPSDKEWIKVGVESGDDELAILIPIYNNSQTVLHQLVPKLKQLLRVQKHSKYKFYLIDSSTDGSTNLIMQELGFNNVGNKKSPYSLNNIPLVYYHLVPRKGGKAWAINQVVGQLTQNYFAIVDSDWILTVDELLLAKELLVQKPQYSYVQLSWKAQNDKKLGFVEGMDQISIEYCHQFKNRIRILNELPVIIHGSAVVIRKSDFLNENGFDDRVLSEDVDLAVRLMLKGRMGVGLSNLSMQECPCDHMYQFLMQKLRWVSGRSQLLKKYFLPIIKSQNLSFKQKFSLMTYFNYYGRFVLVLLSLIFGVYFAARLDDLGVIISLIPSFWLVVHRYLSQLQTVPLKTNKISLLSRLVEPFFYVLMTPFYAYSFLTGFIVQERRWHVIQKKSYT